MFGTAEQDIQLPEKIWVHLTYQSAFVDDAGKLQTRRDVYGLDGRTLAAIKSERGIIDPIQERKREQEVASAQRRAVAPPPRTCLILRVAVRRRLWPSGTGATRSAAPRYSVDANGGWRTASSCSLLATLQLPVVPHLFPVKGFFALRISAASFRHSRLSRFLHRGGRVR